MRYGFAYQHRCDQELRAERKRELSKKREYEKARVKRMKRAVAAAAKVRA